MAERGGGLEALPHGERRLGIGRERHVERRVEPLARIADALAEAACGLELLDLLRREVRAIGADLLEEIERLLAARPLLEHLRRRLDEVALHARSRLGVVVGLREHALQPMAELMPPRFQLV